MQGLKLFTLMLALGGAPAILAQGDLDVEGAERDYLDAKDDAERAERVYRGDEQNYQTYQRRYEDAKREEERLRDSLQVLRRKARDLEGSIRDLEYEISRHDGLIRDKERELSDLQGYREERVVNRRYYFEQRDLTQSKINDLDRQISQAQQDGDDALVARLQSERAEEVRNLDFYNRRISANTAELSRVDGLISDLQRQIRNLENQHQANQRELPRKRNELRNVERDIDGCERDLDRAEYDTQDAFRLAENYRRERDRSYADWQDLKREADRAEDYWRSVQRNYERYRDQVFAAAAQQGGDDGAREGRERAANVGTDEGRSEGRSQGLSAGQRDSSMRSRIAGYLFGRRNAQTDDSLAASYQQGLNLGERLAETKASEVDFPRGYNQELSRTLAEEQASQSVTVDISESIGDDEGGDGIDLASSNKPIGSVDAPEHPLPSEPGANPPSAGNVDVRLPPQNDSHFDPPCAGLLRSELAPECRRRYSDNYAASYRAIYLETYRSDYRAAFNRASAQAYQDAFEQDDTEASMNGRRQGAKDAGELDGFAEAYPRLRSLRQSEGVAAFQDALDDGHLIVVRRVELVETSGDGILMPGEEAKLRVVVENLGRLASPKEGITLRISDTNNADGLNFEMRGLPALAADTSTTLEGAVSMASTAQFAGQEVSLVGSIKTASSGVTLNEFSVGLATHFPTELVSIRVDNRVPTGAWTDAVFTFKNMSNTPLEDSVMYLGARTNGVEVDNAEGVEVAGLDVGEEIEVSAPIRVSANVSDPAEVDFSAKSEAEVTQLFKKTLDVERVGSLQLLDSRQRPIASNSVLRVRANQELRFYVRFMYHADEYRRGPFKVQRGAKSHDVIRSGNNSSLSVDYGGWGPGRNPRPIYYAYRFPASLVGEDVWVSSRLTEGRNLLHQLRIKVIVEN